MDKRAICVARCKSHDRVVATCKINGRRIGALMRERGIGEGGNWCAPQRMAVTVFKEMPRFRRKN